MADPKRIGLSGQARGIDPQRQRRNSLTTDETVAAPITLNERGQITLALTGPFTVDGQGNLVLNVGAPLTITNNSPLTLSLALGDNMGAEAGKLVAKIPTATMQSPGLAPALDGSSTRFLSGDGVYRAPVYPLPRLDECAEPTDTTNLDSSTSAHGLLPKLSGSASDVLLGDGTWGAGGGGITDHGLLTGLADDDHAQYVLANGTRSGWPTPTTASAANGVPKADANGRISKDWLPEASIDDFLKAGTTNYTAFYAAGAMTGTALSNWALTANRLYAIPFLSPRRGVVIDQLSAYVSTGVASTNIRFGLYNNKSESELYPDTLFYDAGEFTSTTTNQSRDATGLALTLEPSKIYWAVIVGNGTPSLRAVAAGGGSYVMGLTATNVSAPTVGLYATFTYGALPATFPTAGFTASTNTHPTLFYKLSS